MKFIFCEGKDDLAVIKCIAAAIGLNDLNVEPFEGKDNLGNFLKSVKKRPEFTRNIVSAFGIIRDADDDQEAALQSVQGALAANDFKAPNENGGFLVNGIKVGILVIGPRNGTGMLEDLCLNSVSHNPEFSCVDDYFKCVAQKSERKEFSSKARVRVWMASHADHEAYVGAAAAQGYWPWGSQVFDPLKAFLQQLSANG